MNATNLLLLDCSPRTDNSTNRYFTEHLLPALTARTGGKIQVTRRKIGTEPLPPLTSEYAESLLLSATEAREQYGAALAVSDQLIQELDAADILWISTPVHNFTVPAALKTWIDLVVRRDVTFVATENDKVGLLRDRPTYIAVTSGGAMFHEPPRQPDFFRPYLTTVLGVIGIKDITFVHATGLAFVEEPLTVLEEKAAQWTIHG